MKKLIAVMALTLFTVGCGKGLPKLTEEQKAELKGTMDSAARTERAVPRNGLMNGSADLSATMMSRRFAALRFAGLVDSKAASARASYRDSTELEMRDRLQREREARTCQIDLEQNGSSNDLAHFRLNIQVQGQTCPISLSLAMSFSQSSPTSGYFGFSCDYGVKDEDYRKLNDVDALSIRGGMNVEAESRTHAKAAVDVSGTIHSQKNGSIPMSLKGEFEGDTGSGEANGELVLRFEFPSFVAELKTELDGDKAKYFINDDEVSVDEFSTYFEKLFSN